jgi:hypothetical protein
LLAIEAVGWLHMTGKARADFLREQAGQRSGYDYLRWHEQESPPFPWHDLLEWAKSQYAKVDGVDVGWPDTLTEFLTKHRGKGGAGLLGLLQAAHAMASGIEKNLPTATAGYLGQDAKHLWLSSAFGQRMRYLLPDPPEVLTAPGWERLVREIRRILEELKALGTGQTADVDAWRRWREAAIGPDSYLRRAFSSTLAETRLPNNDVTLWDQSFVAAALFKSAVAGAVLEGGAFPWTDGAVKQKTRWRLLTVGLGADHYEARAVRIGDWTGARLALDDFFARVRTLVEVDLGVGSLLYRDESVQVFSFPAERSNGGGATALDAGPWQDWLQNEIDGFAQDLDLETPPHCQISCKSTRSLVPMTAEIRKVKDTLAVPVHRAWDVENSEGSGHVCPVCLVRHTGRTNDKQGPCKPCKDRRTHRLDAWLENRLGGDTIWISEVADANDRVALVTISLDIEPWIDGTRLDALRTQAISEWRKFNPELFEFWQRDENKRKKEHNPVSAERPFDSLRQEIMKRLGKFKGDDLLFCNLQEGYRHAKVTNDNRSDDEIWSTYFSMIVEDRSPGDQPEWKKDDLGHNAAWLTHQLFCKLASPGRVYRFWRQAEEFFTELLADFREIASRHTNRWRSRRLVLEPEDASKTGWRDREVYGGRWSDKPTAPIDLLYSDDLGGFVTAANLARLLDAHESAGRLEGAEITLRDDAGSERVLRVGRAHDNAGVLGVYHPVIPLELSPLRFRVLLPLEAASPCVDRAAARWKEEFGRVWDRLPLRVGVVAFPRMTPFQAVIEAARNLEDELERGEPEQWRIAERDVRDGVVALHLRRPDSSLGGELRTVPVTVADRRADVFYPYFAVEDATPRFPLDFQHPDGQVYRHALDLRAGDGIRVFPSRVATVFLESTAQRFDELPTRPLAEWARMRDVWRLVSSATPSLTALRGAWAELAERQDAWRTPEGDWLGDGRRVWTELVRAVLESRLRVGGAALDTLVEAAEDGVLAWALDWHLSALKERIPEVTHAQ